MSVDPHLSLEFAVNSLSSGFIIIDRQGMIQFINQKGATLLKLNADQDVKKSIFKLVPGMDLSLFSHEKQSISEVHIDNRKLIFNYSPLYLDGELYGISGLFEEEKYYEGLLKELDFHKNMSLDLKAIFDTSYDVIYVSNNQGITLRASTACKELWGKEEKELIGKSVYELEKAGIFKPSVTRMVLEKKETVSIIQTTKTGRRLMVVGTPIKDENGEIIRVVNASRDITEVSRLQSELNDMRKLMEGYKRELYDLRSRTETETSLVYRSIEMNRVISLAQRVASVDSTILILGETGVGKEVIANYIHKASLRSEKPFITINCGAIPENLLESELFGYEKGAFTGAVKQKMGLFELASEGTLFLDEIGEMPLTLQTKLLRVIQEQKLVRVGGTKPIKINIRLIAATYRDLLEEVKNGTFREDLYYRLNVIPIKIPALRNRTDDVLPIVLHFVEFFNQKYMRSKKLSNSALEVLQQYEWPGNVRELQNIIERLVVLTEKEIIDESELESFLFVADRQQSENVIVNNILPLKECVEEAENQLLELAKRKYKSTSEIASVLGVNQSTISRKLRRTKK
ncbi:sigma 54-interacting transcriptional regulator [Peribacillus butanolivorans]|uniref:sigma 54-interacting transcriptional regulator n=1 Tax=Peribacillus butanolivorans TaxID=421767 RepID=UPI00366B0E2F